MSADRDDLTKPDTQETVSCADCVPSARRPNPTSRRRFVIKGDLTDILRAVVSAAAGDEELSSRLEQFAAALPKGVRGRLTLTITKDLAHRRRRARDQMLQRLAVEHYAALDLHRAAAELAAEIRRYASGRWPSDRRRRSVPAECLSNSLRAQLFEVFEVAGGAVPSSKKQLARILKFAPGRDINTRGCAVPQHGVRLDRG